MLRRIAAILASAAFVVGTQVTLLPAVVAADPAGGLALTTVDPAGTLLVGGCFELYTDAGGGTRGTLITGGKRCDQAPNSQTDKLNLVNDGVADGVTPWAGVAPGQYVAHQTLGVALAGTSARYELAPDTALTITAGAVTARQLVFRPAGGLTIHKVDAAGKPLPGACFTLRAPDGRQQGMCDGSNPDSPSDNLADGLIVWPNLTPTGAPTTYTLIEQIAPAGYAPGTSQQVTVDPITPTELTIRNTTGSNGGLALTTVDPAGTRLVGGCFELYTDAGGGTRGKLVTNGKRCDQAPNSQTDKLNLVNDGLADGVTPWAGVAPGQYVLHQTLGVALAGTPATYEVLPDTKVTITAGEVATLRLVYRPTAGLTIHKVDAAGKPLPGACFTLTAPDGRKQGFCDGPHAGMTSDNLADGLLVLPGLAPTFAPTTYTLTEIVAPAGYAPGSSQQVTVDPITPTELTIRNTIGSSPPDQTQAPGGPTEVTGLDLEISSTIKITRFSYPTAGTSTARATIPLKRGSDGTWAGTGILETTTETIGDGCPSVSISGVGKYDWQVRDLHAGSDVAESSITLGMDSGLLGDGQDTMSLDACAFKDESPTDTWQALFFDAYAGKRQGFGFLVDGWRITDAAAWTSGGQVAEATWTGACQKSGQLECTDATTFRLIVRVGPAGPSTTGVPAPGSTGAPGGAGATPIATLPTDGVLTGGQAPGCTDLTSCLGQYWIVALVAGMLVLGGGFVLLQRLTSGSPATLTEPTLDAYKIEDKIGTHDESLEVDSLYASKVGPTGVTLETDTLGTLEGFEKLADPGVKFGDGSLGATEPLSTDLPPPPGSSP